MRIGFKILIKNLKMGLIIRKKIGMKDMNKMKAEAITKAENFSLKILVISNLKNKYYKAQANTQIRKTVEQSSPINNPKLK